MRWEEGNVAIMCLSLGAGAWFAYFRRKDPSRVSFLLALGALLGGSLSVAGAWEGFERASALGLSADWDELGRGSWWSLGGALLIGVIEEGAKLLAVLAVCFLGRRFFRRPQDVLLFAAFAGVGFASAESATLLFLREVSPVQGLARAVAAPMTHALFAAPWGLGLGELVLRRRIAPLVLGFAVSASAHGLYDLMMAKASTPNIGAALVVLGLWLWVVAEVGLSARTPEERAAVRAMRAAG